MFHHPKVLGKLKNFTLGQQNSVANDTEAPAEDIAIVIFYHVITFDDIAGLEDVKQTVQEVVCWPMKRPDLFTGLRRAPNGLLLYGPPGKRKFWVQGLSKNECGVSLFEIVGPFLL